MSKVVRFHRLGGPEVLTVEQENLRAPGPGEVQLEVRAIGLNRAEALFRRGLYLETPILPSRIGLEVSGVVRALGTGVSSVHVGDAVSTIPGYSQGAYGTYAELALVPADVLVPKSDELSFEQAASVWMPFLTAYGALVEIAHIGPGDFVVITAASSSVGLAAIQVALQAGATPIATTRRETKRAALLELGAATVVVTEEDDVSAAIMAATDGKGARVVFDPVGGRMVLKLAEAMAPSGILFQYGGLSGEEAPFPIIAALGNRLSMRAYTLLEIINDPARRARAVQYVSHGLAAGVLSPKIARTFGLDAIVDAHRYLEGSEQIGKIVVTI